MENEKEYKLKEKTKGCEVVSCKEFETTEWGDWNVCNLHYLELTNTTTLKKVTFCHSL